MARIRTIKPEFFKHEGLAELSPLHRLLFQGLWCHADRAGRLEDRPRRLKVEVLPYDDCDLDAMLSDLARAGFIVRYEVAGQKLIEVPTLAKHQHFNVKEPPSTLPPLPGTNPAPSQNGAGTTPTRQEQEQEQEGKRETASSADASAPPEQVPRITSGDVSPKQPTAPIVEGASASDPPPKAGLDVEVYQRWRELWSPRAAAEPPDKALKLIRDRRKERLRGSTPEQVQADLLRSLAGWRNDPWAERPQQAALKILFRDADQVAKGLELAARAPAGARPPPPPDLSGAPCVLPDCRSTTSDAELWGLRVCRGCFSEWSASGQEAPAWLESKGIKPPEAA